MSFVIFPCCFQYFIFVLNFCHFDYYVSWWVLFGFILLEFCELPGLGWLFMKFSATISSNIFLGPLSLSFSSGTPIMQMLVHLILSQWLLMLSSFSFFHSFSIFCSVAAISTILSSRSLIHSSASVILLLIPSRVLFISVCVLLWWTEPLSAKI